MMSTAATMSKAQLIQRENIQMFVITRSTMATVVRSKIFTTRFHLGIYFDRGRYSATLMPMPRPTKNAPQ